METHSVVYFDLIDYVVFGFMLLISALIGVYFAFWAKIKQNTTNEYLMGGKTMGIFPISMSLIASYISGISLLGIPAEMYMYGTQFWIVVLSECFVSLAMAVFILPVFFTLQITSSYEYLNMRFNNSVRLLGSCIFLLKQLLYIPIVIYVPALAFSQVTGVNLHLITPVTCIICIFYTTLGGLKAVVWTDTVQTIIMFSAVIIVLVLGTIKVGGVGIVWERAEQSGRIEFFNMDINPTIRHTFWTVFVGNFFSWLASCSVNQAMVQRCLSMPTLKMANRTVLILAIGIMFIVSMSCYTGTVIYAMFHDCDPIVSQKIKKPDQLLPYFVMNFAGWIPGLPGLFVSGVFSAALSSMSTGLNSMTGVILEDLIKPVYKKPISEARASLIMKIVVVIIGTICVGLVFLVEKMGTLIQAAKSMSSITAGPLLGIFMLGMFFPWANAKGALLGGLLGVSLVAWMSLGTQVAMAQGLIHAPRKPVSIDGCSTDDLQYLQATNATIIGNDQTTEPPFFMYRLSYMYYSAVGTVTVLIFGMIISFLTGPNDVKSARRELFTPIIHKYLPESIITEKPKVVIDQTPSKMISVKDASSPIELRPLNSNKNKM